MQFLRKALHAAVCLGLAAAILLTAGCASRRGDRTTGQYVDDIQVANRVEDALGDDPLYKFRDVKVTAYRGNVQLSGFVQTDQQKSRAAEIASRVNGVTEVVNSILVRPLTPTGRPEIRNEPGTRLEPTAPAPVTTP